MLDDKNVENKGWTYLLSAIASLLKSDKECGGAEVFYVKGEWLNDIRSRLGM